MTSVGRDEGVEAQELCQLWLVLERAAVVALGPEDLVLKRSTRRSTSAKSVTSRHADLHRRLAAGADNAWLSRLLDEVLRDLEPHLRLALQRDPDLLDPRILVGQILAGVDPAEALAAHIGRVSLALANEAAEGPAGREAVGIRA